jgi:hypothetical protein
MIHRASLRQASRHRRWLLLTLLLVVFVAGCSNLIYLTGQKAIPLGPAGEQERTPIYRYGEWTIARASMHNHTTFSDGVRTPEDLLELARREGIAVLAYNDHREGGIKIKHGPRIPVNGIERKGVGYNVYFDRLRPLREQSRDILVLIGAEVNPFLYNFGKVPYLNIAYQNRHLTVYGIDDPQVFWEMPVWREVDPSPPMPYQDLSHFQEFIDYIRRNGGIVMAAHVESKQDDWVGPVHFFDQPPINHIHDLRHLDAFSILPEAYHALAGGAGGIWDTTLLEYLMGMRDQAPWCMGDADYHGPEGGLTWSTTLFYLHEFTPEDVYAAIREGRMVALMGESFQDSYVAEFSVSEAGKAPANPIMFAQTLTVSSPPVIRFRLDHEVPDVRTRLIRNGQVILEKEGSSLEYSDAEMVQQKMPAYYRVEVVGPVLPEDEAHRQPPERESELFTNPIFVKF